MRKRSWFVALAVVALVGVTFWMVYVDGFSGGYSKFDVARSQASTLTKVCYAYRLKTYADGKFPAKLVDLVSPPDGSIPLLDGGEAAILDPWGKPFRYAVVETEDGPVPYVWIEREVRGRLRLIGARLGPNEKYHFFGRSDG